MRRFLLSLALLAVLGAPALAGEVEARQANIARLEQERARLVTTQTALVADQQKKVAESIKAEKARRFNKGTKKAEAHEAGLKAAQGAAKIAETEKKLLAERKALVAALYAASLANPADTRLAALYASEKAKLPAPVKKLKIADERIEPTDDPEDLDDKARRLKKSENDLIAEIERADARAAKLRTQLKMAKSQQLSKRDPFQDTQKGRKGAHSESRGTAAGASAGDRNDAETGGGGAGGGAPPPAEPGAGGAFTDEDANQNQGPTPAGTTPLATESPVDVTVQYTDVIDQTTIDQLKQMEKSSDPETRAKAAEKLSAALKARAERVKQQRQAIEKRAKQLRGR